MTKQEKIELAYTMGEIRAVLDQETGITEMNVNTMLEDIILSLGTPNDKVFHLSLQNAYANGYDAVLHDEQPTYKLNT